jgi:hypothetical protein
VRSEDDPQREAGESEGAEPTEAVAAGADDDSVVGDAAPEAEPEDPDGLTLLSDRLTGDRGGAPCKCCR